MVLKDTLACHTCDPCNSSLGSLEDIISPQQRYRANLNLSFPYFFFCCYLFTKWNIYFIILVFFRSSSFLSLSFPALYSTLPFFAYPSLSVSPSVCLFVCLFFCLFVCLLLFFLLSLSFFFDFLFLSSTLKISCVVSLTKNYRPQGAKSTDRAILRKPKQAIVVLPGDSRLLL